MSRCWKILLLIGTSRSWKNGLPETAQGQSCIWEGAISGQVSRQLNAHWIAQSASPLLSCFTWDTMSSFGMSLWQKEDVNTVNEVVWLGAGVHNGCVKTQQSGRGGSGASHHQCPDNKGNLHRRQVKIYSEVQRRKGAMIKRFNEGNLDQRYGKNICTPTEISLSMEI